MNTPVNSCNAWIFLLEDDPSGYYYKTPGSSYQNLIDYKVYNQVDMLFMCFVDTVPTSADTVPTQAQAGNGFTIQMQQDKHKDGTPNQQYMTWVMEDARAINPEIKILVTMGYADDEFSQIFGSDSSQWPAEATAYAKNIVTYLKHYNLDGFDIDWEGGFSYATSLEQNTLLLNAIRSEMNAVNPDYLLTMCPQYLGHLDGNAVNPNVDLISLQLYGGANPSEWTGAGVNADLLAYGAKFEVNGDVPYENAQHAYNGYKQGNYVGVTQWRLNSNDFNYEQAQQMILFDLMKGEGTSFDDSLTIGAAGNPLISSMTIRSGNVLDAIQATNHGSFESNNNIYYELLQHGGNGGTESNITISENDPIVELSGFKGDWYGWDVVLQITLTTQSGKTFGPFGTMDNASSKTPFSYKAPSGESIVAFSGSIVNVPLAGGGNTDVIQTLNVTTAATKMMA